MSRLAVGIATLLLSATSALPTTAADCHITGRWGARGAPVDLELVGNTLYAADQRGVAMYDVSRDHPIRQIGAVESQRPSRSLAVSGERLALLTDETIEIRSSADLHLLASAPVEAVAVAMSGDTIVTAGSDIILWSFEAITLGRLDTRKPQHPATSVKISNAAVYVANETSGIEIFEKVDSSLEPRGSIATVALDLEIDGTRLYVAQGRFGLTVHDIFDPNAPQLLSTLTAGLSDVRRIDVSGTRIVALDHRSAVHVIDAGMSPPAIVSSTPMEALATEGDGTRFFASRIDRDDRGFEVIPSSPIEMYDTTRGPAVVAGTFFDRSGPVGGVATDGSYAYLADPPFFRVIDIRDPMRPLEVASLPLIDTASGVRLFGQRALVYGRGTAYLIDISTPDHPRFMTIYRSGGMRPAGATLSGPYLLHATPATGFHVVNYSNPDSPYQIGGLKNDGYGQFIGVVALDGVAYGITTAGVKVIDLENPAKPLVRLIIRAPLMADATILERGSSRTLVALDGATLRFFDLGTPKTPVEIGAIELGGFGVSVDAQGELAYVVTRSGELIQIDTSNLALPRILHRERIASSPMQVGFAGDIVAVADRFSLIVVKSFGPPVAVDTPTLALEVETFRSGHLQWTPSAADQYEVEISSSSDFTNAVAVRTATPSRLVEILEAPRFARVRAHLRCGTSAWSNGVAIGRSSVGDLVFGIRGVAILARKNESIAIDVPVRNLGSEPRVPTLTSTFHDAISFAASAVAPGEERAIPVTIDVSKIDGQDSVELLLDGGESNATRFRIHLIIPETPIASPGSNDHLLIPGTGSTPGARGTMWQSDLNLFCAAGEKPCAIHLRYGIAGARESHVVALTLPPSVSITIEDFVRRLFGLQFTSGWLEIRSPQLDRIDAWARTDNVSTAGRFGQKISAQRRFAGDFRRSKSAFVPVETDDRARTNLGLINDGSRTETVSIQLLNDSSEIVAATTIVMEPGTALQRRSDEFFEGRTVEVGSVAIESADAVVLYASRIDQRTGDATFLSGRASTASGRNQVRHERVIPIAGSTRGANQTNWKTALRLTRLAGVGEIEVTFLPTDGGSPARSTIELSGRTSWSSADVMASLFPALPPADASSGSLIISSPALFDATARIYNDSPRGEFGQSIEPSGNRCFGVLFPVEETSTRRTNFGIYETRGKPASLELTVTDSVGALLARTEYPIDPRGQRSLAALLRDLGLSRYEGLRVSWKTAGEGCGGAYASVVENDTGDAMYLD